jgi:MFS family permease
VAEAGRPAGVPRPLALLVAGAFFMEMLDGTIVATAAPSIARSFGIRSVDIGIAITAYLVTVAVLIPLSRWPADRIGARRLFFLAVLVFTVASALCAASTWLATIAAVSLRFGEAVLGAGPADAGPNGVALVVIAALILTGAATGLRMPRDAGELVRSGIAR